MHPENLYALRAPTIAAATEPITRFRAFSSPVILPITLYVTCQATPPLLTHEREIFLAEQGYGAQSFKTNPGSAIIDPAHLPSPDVLSVREESHKHPIQYCRRRIVLHCPGNPCECMTSPEPIFQRKEAKALRQTESQGYIIDQFCARRQATSAIRGLACVYRNGRCDTLKRFDHRLNARCFFSRNFNAPGGWFPPTSMKSAPICARASLIDGCVSALILSAIRKLSGVTFKIPMIEAIIATPVNGGRGEQSRFFQMLGII